MKRKLTIVLVFLALLALTWGCSGNSGGSGVLPEAQQPSQDLRGGTGNWGLYQVSVDLNSETVDIIQLRQSEYIINVLGFMEPPALLNLAINFDTLIIDGDNNYIGVDVILKHPIPDPVFKGFDVRGICIGPEVTNADGLTIMMNPGDFAGVPFGYMDGLLGAPNSYASYDGIWGYKYFCDGLDMEDDLATYLGDEDNLLTRGVFNEGSQNMRHYDLSWAETLTPVDFLVFNYAVYANYNWPTGDPPFTVDSFEITAANAFEAICAVGTPVANTVWYEEEDEEGGGMLTLDVEVWDWQGAESATVTIESLTPGVMAQTPSDANIAGTTSKSWIYTFTDVPAVPVSAGDLDILITVTDVEETFGSAWFFELLDPGHEFFDQLLWCSFITSVPVAEEGPAAGFSIKDSGDLPATLPTSNEKNFCVVGDDTFGKMGVYYHWGTTGNYTLHKYPLDYSTTSTLFCSMVNPWGPMDSWFGSPADMGSVEVSPMGAFIVNTRAASPDPFWAGPARRCHHLYGTTCNAVNVWLVYNMQAVDTISTFDAQAIVYSWAKGDPTSVAPGYTYKHDPPYEGGSDWMPGYYPPGAGDGLVDENHTRGGMDSAPNFTGWDCMVAFVEGTTTATSAVEVYKNFKTIPSPSSVWTLKGTNGLVGRAKDVSWLNNYGEDGFEDAVGNYMCVLEDNEDGTWQVSCWEWDNAGAELLLVARYDTPIDGTPLNLDCDTVNQEIHVWCDDGTAKYYIFHFG